MKPVHANFKNVENPLNDDQIEKILNSINRIKKIDDVEFNSSFYKIMRSYNRVILHKIKLKEYYKEKFDATNKEHVNMLLNIWETLKASKDINLVDRRWCKFSLIIYF
jgi:hypothetical protein